MDKSVRYILGWVVWNPEPAAFALFVLFAAAANTLLPGVAWLFVVDPKSEGAGVD